MTFQEIITLTQPVKAFGPEPQEIGALSQDSREISKGDVFIAIKGERVDGHHFVDEAVEKGAAVVICEEKPEELTDTCVLCVENTRKLLGPLAQAFEGDPAREMTAVGITGTNGKTTVATLIYQVLREVGVNVSLLGTVEKRINEKVLDSSLTTADPIELARDMRQMVEAGSTHVVMEVSSHALQQERVEGINFEIAAYTNLSHDHLDYHEGMEDYAAAKKLLFDRLTAEAKAVINADDDYADYMSSDCKAKKINFSFKKGPQEHIDCRISSGSSDEGLVVQVGESQIKSPLVGDFNAYNLAQSFLICKALGLDKREIIKALETAKGAPGRLEKVQAPDVSSQPVVMVDYAHTPGALENVLNTLAGFKQEDQTLHVVFGCGGDRDKSKRPKMAAVAQRYADRITVTSDNPRSEDPDAIIDDAMEGFSGKENIVRITDRRKAITDAIKKADVSTVILIAGKGHETYQEVKGVRHHFDDREVALEALGHSNGNPKNEEVA